jgi:hypothetical protein
LLPAADPQLVSLVMPDAKVLAGVNVSQAKASPLGQYVLNQMQAQSAQLQQFATLTGFDPTRDVQEVLLASNGTPGGKTGLVLARGTFDANRIQALIQAGGGSTEVYNGATLLEDPMKQNAVAFLNPSLAVAGDVLSVKGAIDRQASPTVLDPAVQAQVTQWSGSEDAWVISNTPPAHLTPPAVPGGPDPALLNALQNIQQGAGGVKFGAQVVFSGQAQADTPQNAASMASLLQFGASLVQMQTQQKNPQLGAIMKSLSINSNGNLVNVALSVPESQIEQAMKAKAAAATPQSNRRPAGRL